MTINWREFLDTNSEAHCSLCGNTGIIDTTGLCTPAGYEVGRLNYCICPNGRKLKQVRNGQPPQEVTYIRKVKSHA